MALLTTLLNKLKLYTKRSRMTMNYFFKMLFSCPMISLGHYQGGNLTHSMLLLYFYIFDPKITRSLVAIIVT